jgi:hypothetical protein
MVTGLSLTRMLISACISDGELAGESTAFPSENLSLNQLAQMQRCFRVESHAPKHGRIPSRNHILKRVDDVNVNSNIVNKFMTPDVEF